MWEDPIVAEVHRVREMLAAKFNYDIEAYFADMMKRQVALGDRLVLPKKEAIPSQAAKVEGQALASEAKPSKSAPAA